MISSTHCRRAIFVAFAACVCISGPVFADGQPKDVVVFGDSLSDPGNAFALTHTVSNTPYAVIPDAPYTVGGLHFSNGKTWIEQRPADNVNAQSSGPAYQVHGVFTNYAVGGARARTVSGGVNLGAQVQTYLDDFGGNAKASSTFVIFIGGNDIRDALADPQNASTILGLAVISVSDVVQVLYNTGARKFVVVYVPDLGLVPAVRLAGAAAQAGATFLSATYNSGLGQAIAQLSALPYISIASVDLFSDIQDVVAHPASYGLTDTTDMCITPGVKGNAKCNNPNDYLFWDGIHPTSAGHAILAEFIGSAL